MWIFNRGYTWNSEQILRAETREKNHRFLNEIMDLCLMLNTKGMDCLFDQLAFFKKNHTRGKRNVIRGTVSLRFDE